MADQEGVPRRELSEAQHRSLVSVLDRLRDEFRARSVFLAETCGRPVAMSTGQGEADLDSLGSLAASAAAAAGSLGQMIGEADVSLLLQRGERDLVQLTPAGGLVLAVMFGKDSLQGLERLRARLRQRRALGEIRSVLGERGSGGFAELDNLDEQEIEALLGPVGPEAG